MAEAELAFLTGFPGFIGRRLVARLLADDPQRRVVALVEPRMADQARSAAAEIGADRIEVLPGDIGERTLGLSEQDRERLAAEVTVAYHLAAIYDLAVPLTIAQRVNVEGTGNVLELCLRCERLTRLNYVSTAYVAGDRTGVVYEHELALGQGFKNHYESTKFQAELWVRDAMDRLPVTIYRPAIVVGDSRSGETQKFDGPYYMLRSISVARRRGLPVMQFRNADAPFNVVPVDFVLAGLVAAAQDPAAEGRTLHLVDPEPVTARELMELLAREYTGSAPRMRLPAGLVSTSLRSKAVRRFSGGIPRESFRYLNHPVRFDVRQATDVLSRSGLRCPRFEEYVAPMVRFFSEHEDDAAFAAAAA